MDYMTAGRAGLSVSRICLGCMSYGSPAWRPWVLDEAAAQPFFRRAVELGINFFDTADMYSLGASEEVTGRALREYTRLEEVVIATKVYFPMSDRPNMGGLSRKHVVQACEASCRARWSEAQRNYHPVNPTTELLHQVVWGKGLHPNDPPQAWRWM